MATVLPQQLNPWELSSQVYYELRLGTEQHYRGLYHLIVQVIRYYPLLTLIIACLYTALS